jgi:hypothetical protein
VARRVLRRWAGRAMTATIAPAGDLDGVIKRADARWAGRNGDEPAAPEYLKAIVAAVRPLLGQPPGGPVDDVQVQKLLADKQRLADLVDELRKQADTRGKIVERQARELTALKQDLGAADVDARRRVDAAAEAMQAPLKAAQDEADKLRQALVLRTQELDEAREKLQARSAIIERREADVAQLHGTVDELRAKLTAVEQAKPPHQHRYVVDAPTTEPRPCECGQPYPRAAIATEAVEPSPPEPWAELFGQIRDEAKKAGWKA